MELEHIFRPQPESFEGLWAVRYPDSSENCFVRLFEKWNDAEWMYNFCKFNTGEIERSFGEGIAPADAAEMLMDEAEDLKSLLYEYAMGGPLQEIFLPLHNQDGRLVELQLSKAKLIKKNLRNLKLSQARLRIYAIRIDAASYVVTGGAIKLTHLMSQSTNTENELRKLNKVRDWLKDNGIIDGDEMTEL